MFEKTGYVTSIYPERCTAKVQFDDQDGLISDELQIVVRGSQKNKDYWMPSIGEQVFCSFTQQKKGFIIGTIYSDADLPLVTDANKRGITFEDGTSIEYDSKSQTLSVDCKGPINIKGNIHVEGTITSTGGG